MIAQYQDGPGTFTLHVDDWNRILGPQYQIIDTSSPSTNFEVSFPGNRHERRKKAALERHARTDT